MDIYIGFDSAWTDSQQHPGAICAVGVEAGRMVLFVAPQLVSFAQALEFIREFRSDNGLTLIALDQPTIVPNLTGMRPVERVAASLISWLGGGVQPANRQKVGMFCDDAPIWGFLDVLGAVQDPNSARIAGTGLYLMEVFPALALASLGFFGPKAAPHYNPGRKKTFRIHDWERVGAVAAKRADDLGCEKLAEWCRCARAIHEPRKADQDKLDAALCALIALRWRTQSRDESVMLGDLSSGYMVTPATAAVRERLSSAATKCGVAIDGVVPNTLAHI